MDPHAAVKFILLSWGNRFTEKLTDQEIKTLPKDWQEIVTVAAVRHKSGKSVRFLTTKIINFSDSKIGYCRLCCGSVEKPARYWHKECWDAVYPYSNAYWKKIVRSERRRRGRLCASCGLIGRHQADHILAVALGGKNEVANLQFLCKVCHLAKTNTDMTKIKLLKTGYSIASCDGK